MFDIAHVVASGSNFNVRAMNIGEAVLKVWDAENPAVSDYVRIKVGNGISPSKVTVPLGQLLCFKTSVNPIIGQGAWSTTSPALSIDSASGKAIAKSVGSGMVYYNDDVVSIYTEINVIQPSSIIVKAGYIPVLQNTQSKKVFTIPFSVASAESSVDISLSQCDDSETIDTPFVCKIIVSGESLSGISATDLFDVSVVYSGSQPTCVLTAKPLTPSIAKAVSGAKRTIALQIVLTDSVKSTQVSSEAVSITYVPDIFIDMSPIQLSEGQMSQVVAVHGVSELLQTCEIIVADSASVTSSATVVGDSRLDITFSMTTGVTSSVNTSAMIKCVDGITMVSLPITVVVLPKPEPETPVCQLPPPPPVPEPIPTGWSDAILQLFEGTSSWLLGYSIVLATVILVVILYHVTTRNRQPQYVVATSPYAVPQSPPPYYPGSPYPTLSPQQKTLSPRTPQTRTLFSVSQ